MRLDLRQFSAGYGETTIVRNVDLNLPSGQSLAIVGRNGMGKTTLLRGVLGYLASTSGSVRLGDAELRGQPTFHIIRRGVAYAPQEQAIVEGLSVAENLDAAGLSIRVSSQRRDEMFAHFPILARRMRQRAGTLSGGEQKMLVLARALLAQPRLLVLDEISAGLQPAILNVVVNALRMERQRREVTVLMVEQNLDFVMRVADRIAVLLRGELAWECPAHEQYREQLARELSL
jgi:branched-chain amino acid transport system ATP-binding protein